jgi:hypothetical protein
MLQTTKVILRPGDNTTAQAAVQQEWEITHKLLFQLNETTGPGPMETMYLYIRSFWRIKLETITAEAVSAALLSLLTM